MKSFNYVITIEKLDAKPAAALCKKVAECKSTVMIHRGEKSARAGLIMSIMMMGFRRGDSVTVTVEGEDENTAAPAMEKFFKANL